MEFKLSDGNTFPFPDNKFDVIFMVTVLGEVQNKINYIKEFYRVLKHGDIVAVSEQVGDPDFMSSDNLKNLFSDNGFKLESKYSNKLYYTLFFKI